MSQENQEQARNIIALDYSNMVQSYSNQSSIQVSSEDISIQFAVSGIDKEGKEVMKVENLVRMSDSHFEKFVINCNNALDSIKKLNAK